MKKIQIFSPHIDDAILSLGGSIVNWRLKGHHVIVRNIFSISNWTHLQPLSQKTYESNTNVISSLRKNEEMDVAKHLNFAYEFWDFFDRPLRLDFSVKNNQMMENQIQDRISKCLNSHDSFFFPLGVDHPDHLLLRRLSDNFISGDYDINFYEDMPYFSWGNFDYGDAVGKLEKDKYLVTQRINLKEKDIAVRKYSSQITESFLKNMKAYSYNISDNKYYERYWKQL